MADSANIVDLILAKPFESVPYEEKLRINQQRPPSGAVVKRSPYHPEIAGSNPG